MIKTEHRRFPVAPKLLLSPVMLNRPTKCRCEKKTNTMKDVDKAASVMLLQNLPATINMSSEVRLLAAISRIASVRDNCSMFPVYGSKIGIMAVHTGKKHALIVTFLAGSCIMEKPLRSIVQTLS